MMTRRPLILLLAFAPTSAGVPTMAGGFDRAIESVLPRVVKLYGLSAGMEKGYGTGVIVSQDGLVLTVSSLLIDARRIRAVLPDGEELSAKVVSRDRDRQLALLQLRRDERGAEQPDQVAGERLDLPYFDLSAEVPLAPGDWVIAAGNAFKIAEGPEPVSIAHGVFSARTRLDARRRIKDFPYHGDVLVIDAITSNPGAPGSAMVNLEGRFVGMIGRQVVSNLTHTHFNYAMPRDVLYDFFREATADPPIPQDGSAASFVSSGRIEPSKPKLALDTGIRLSRIGYRAVLPFVERVRPGSPAAKAGVRKDDLILSVNGRTVSTVAEYHRRLRLLEPGDEIDLVVRRGKSILTFQIKKESPK